MITITIDDKYAIDDYRRIHIGSRKFWWPFPIASMIHSSAAVVFGVSVYGNLHKLWIINKIHDVFCAIDNAVRWVQYRVNPRHQYHIVQTGLRPGYHDIDEVMLHAMMSLLCKYVELERGGDVKLAERIECIQRDHGEYEESDDAALTLYRWWKYERESNWADYNAKLHSIYSGRTFVTEPTENKLVELVGLTEPTLTPLCTQEELWDLEAKLQDDDQKMLHKLVDIRRTLWS